MQIYGRILMGTENKPKGKRIVSAVFLRRQMMGIWGKLICQI